MTNQRCSSEHSEQAGFVTWFRIKFPKVLIFAIPNGGFRNMSVAKQLLAEGVVKGIPDLYIPSWKCWIEMKRIRGGVLSPHQKEKIAYLESCGDTVIVGYGAEDASKQMLVFVEKNGKK